MLKQVIDFFGIEPDLSMDLMIKNQTLTSLSSKILSNAEDILEKVKPEILLVQGDTTTAFLLSLIAFYNKIKVGHVEAGLRTYDKSSPFPEEINRQLISRTADLHFTPTKRAHDNLIEEGIEPKNIFITGNTIVDAINWGIRKVENNKSAIESREVFRKLDINKKLILVTMHRRESFGEDINNICNALKKITLDFSDVQIIYPVHLNPNVRKPVYDILSNIDNITLIDPLDYASFLWLMNKSYFIVTDSGGIQEEAPALEKPVLVIRKKTERGESVELGISRLIGTSTDNIVKNISELLENDEVYSKMIPTKNPYGDGKAAEKIVNIIFDSLR